MAKRYSQAQKKKVVAFIQKHNSENGRGGQSAAAKKFSINPITIRSWMDKAGLPAGKSTKRVRERAKVKGGGTSDSTVQVLQRMTTLQEQITSLQSEYDQLRSRI